jgi:hypothetical protein
MLLEEFWRRGGILSKHPKKFSVAIVKLKLSTSEM